MKQLGLVGAVILAAACGGKSNGTIGSTGGGGKGNPPAIVIVSMWGLTFEGMCHADDCEALRKRMWAEQPTVKAGGATWKIVGERADLCEASGQENTLVEVEKLDGPEDAEPGLLVWPEGVDVKLRMLTGGPETTPEVSADVRAAIARLAVEDRKRMQLDAVEITADDIGIEQVIEANVDGAPGKDLMYAAVVPLAEDAGPGYVWSGLIVVPDGEAAKMYSAWSSDLEHVIVHGLFDLEGDGVDELLYTAEYYEGSMHAAGGITDRKLLSAGEWGCGA